MNYYLPTDEELRLIRQRQKSVYVKIQILNNKFLVIEELTGNLIDDSINIESESKQRRTYNCTLIVTDGSFMISPNSKIWIDKYIRVYYGISSSRTSEIYYWLLGTFTFISPNYSWSATASKLSLSCADLMADYDGTKQGQLTGANSIGTLETDARLRLNMSYSFKINAVAEYETNADGSYKLDSDGLKIIKSYMKMSDAVRATLDLAGIPKDRYFIEEETDESLMYVPYDMEFNAGQTFCEIWTKLAELYPSWEFFFDKSGNFVWQKIPTGYEDECVLDNDFIEEIFIDETQNSTFQGIYNATEVWGKTFELTLQDRYADSSTYDDSSNTYTISLDVITPTDTKPENIGKIETYFNNYDRIGIKMGNANSADNFKIHIIGKENNASVLDTTLSVVDSSGNPIKANVISANKAYVFTYYRIKGYLTNCLVLDGSTQAYGYYEEKNPDCPYSSTSLGYVIPQRISVDTDFTDDLCYNRAEKLTYEVCAMKDTITLKMLIVPWLGVNEKVQYILRNSPIREQELQLKYNKKPQWMIKSISWSTLDGTMSVNMYRFREDFSYVYDRTHGNGGTNG